MSMSSPARPGWRALVNAPSGTLLLLCEILALYALYGWHPIYVYTVATVDDGLYVQHATGFLKWLAGKSESWLGGFDCFLLAKVPLYGLWLAFLSLLGMPLRVGDFLLFLAGAFLFRRAVRPVRELRAWEFGVVLFLLLANPFVPQDFPLRRLTFHIALTNLCLIASVGLALRAQASTLRRVAWALLLGICFGACYLDREETVWLLVAVGIAFLILWLQGFGTWRRREQRGRLVVRDHALVLLAFAATALPPILTVCTLNLKYYGVFMTAFRRSPGLNAVMQRLTSLEPSRHQPYIPIARPTRMRAYELSPSFAKLKPFLEEKPGDWRAGNPAQSTFNGHKPEEKEFFVSYFEFSLLWAANQAGAKRAHEMEALFHAIDGELGQAVREGKIAAGASGPAILAAPVPGDYRRMVSAFWMALSSVLLVKNPGYQWPPADWPKVSRALLEEAGNLTNSWVTPQPLPNLQHRVREPFVRRIKQVQTVLFPLLFLAMPVLVLARRREAFTTNPSSRGLLLWSFVLPVVSLAVFCLGMAVLHVLGFPFLATMGYAVLGYSPLTVLCALSATGLCVFLLPAPAARQNAASAPENKEAAT
jgi:hypothetical protein